MSSTCWACKKRVIETDLFCPDCHKIQPVNNIDPFTLFGLPTFFDIDSEKISDIYFVRLRQLHPDRFVTKSEEEKKYALEQVSRLNDSYQILCNPAERAAYLIKIAGWEVPTEENEKLSKEMMIQQFALRETLEEVKDVESLTNLKGKVREEVKECLSMLDKAFQRKEKTIAQCKTVELQFLQKFQYEIDKHSKKLS